MHINRFSILALVFAGLGLGGAAKAGGPAMAKSFIVNVTFDAPDANTADGECNALPDPNGPKLCTLRAAIMQGNTYGPAWDIGVVLVPGMQYSLSIPGADEVGSKTGSLDVLRPMRIGVPEGSAPNAKIDGAELDRVFGFFGNSTGSVLYGLNIVGGKADKGAAVFQSGLAPVLIDRSYIHNNESTFSNSGAVTTFKGTMHVRDSRIAGNDGCGADANSMDAELVVERTTIDANTACGVGLQGQTSLVMTESTVSGNGREGLLIFSGSAVVKSTSFVGNGALFPGGAGRAILFVNNHDASLILSNSVLVSSAGSNCSFGNGEGDAVTYTQYNVYSDASCFSDVLIDHSLHNTDPMLSELGDWDGPTPTHMPLSGSPAIDNAPASLCAGVTDQRGEPRPVAHDGNVEPRCDAGAVELKPLVVIPPEDPWIPKVFGDGFEGCNGC